MKIFLFVEGKTERVGLHHFLKRWLDEQPELVVKPKLVPIKYDGYAAFVEKIPKRVAADLKNDENACAVGLLDLYALRIPGFDLPQDRDTRYGSAKQEIERRVRHPRFIQHFAVHETEAWLLAKPTLFPKHAADQIGHWGPPESVNFNRPPAKRLNEVKASPRGRNNHWDKPLDGARLFNKLHPNEVAAACPYFRLFLEDMRDLAIRCSP